MSQMEVNEHGFVVFHQPDPARGDEIQLEYYKWALDNIKEMEKQMMTFPPPTEISTNLRRARYHCEERIKFYAHRPTVMRSG